MFVFKFFWGKVISFIVKKHVLFCFAKKISALILDLSCSFSVQIPPQYNTMRIANILYIRSRSFSYNLISHVNFFSHQVTYKRKIFKDRRMTVTQSC
jgi:hypothetical protein